ncbi:MAG: DUF1254 domain-containing protein [Candidatus Bathyarchaeia archaeon]
MQSIKSNLNTSRRRFLKYAGAGAVAVAAGIGVFELSGSSPPPASSSTVPATTSSIISVTSAPPAEYAMTTPIPSGIVCPNTVNTRFGTLVFFDGFPDNASVQKIYDNLDFQRAVQAYLLALPALNQAGMRSGTLALGPANTTVPYLEKPMDSTGIFLTAAVEVYTGMWLDLSNGPIVFEAPPAVAGSINDMWYRWVADIGLTGADKGNGGKYLILPPGYNGPIPSGYSIVQPQTFNNWLFWRSVPTKQYPQPSTDLVKQYTRIYPLSEAANPPPTKFINMSGKPWCTVAPADYTSWETLNQILQQEPTNSLDSLRLGYFASIGIQKGQPFAPDDRMKAILTEAAAVGDATARAITYKIRGGQEDYYYPNSAWRIPLPGGYQFQEQPGVLNLDDYISYFFLATGVTPAMVGAGSAQTWACLDSNGNPFDGGKNYKLHLPPNIPIKQDWSVVVYDNQTRSMLQTDQEYPSVGSTTPGLQVNSDGSVDVYFGPTAPAGEENNWVQTIPGKGWNILLRLHMPTQPWFDKTWRPGEIEPQP